MSIETLEKQLLDGLLKKKDLLLLRDILLTYKNESGSQREAYLLLKKMRIHVADEFGEEQEDRVLEMMDIVTSYCSPPLKIWEEALKEE